MKNARIPGTHNFKTHINNSGNIYIPKEIGACTVEITSDALSPFRRLVVTPIEGSYKKYMYIGSDYSQYGTETKKSIPIELFWDREDQNWYGLLSTRRR